MCLIYLELVHCTHWVTFLTANIVTPFSLSEAFIFLRHGLIKYIYLSITIGKIQIYALRNCFVHGQAEQGSRKLVLLVLPVPDNPHLVGQNEI